MKRGNRLLSILALSVLSPTAGLATQPAPTQGIKAATEAHSAHQGSKTGVAAQKKTQTSGGTSHQIWRRINAARSKESAQGLSGKIPDAGPTGTRSTAAATATITKSARTQGASPAVGAVGTRNVASISGTGMHLKGTTPAVIHPAAKYGARISGTGIAGKN